jgi:hypothetical protein
MKRNTDRRYYNCPNRACMGQVAPVLEDEGKRPIFVCSQCQQKFAQTTVDQAYRLLKMSER